MFPTISESSNGFLSLGLLSGAFSGLSTGIMNGVAVGGTVNGHRSLTEEEQHLYNHHIIENFVESVREMNDVVLIPSKLKDLDPSSAGAAAAVGNKVQVELNDDLYSYYQMINVVKNDLFEPHTDDSMKKQLFQFPKRKISRQHRRDEAVPNQVRTHSRNLSGSSLSSMLQSNNNNNNNNSMNNNINNNNNNNNNNNPPEIRNGKEISDEGTITPPPNSMMPLTPEQLVGQSAKQLTLSFIHHLHSLYTILEHFTKAADFITERYQHEVESNI